MSCFDLQLVIPSMKSHRAALMVQVIEAGFKIRVGIVEEAIHGVDTPEQLEDLNKKLKSGEIKL